MKVDVMPTVKKIKSQSIISIRVIASINQSINRSLHQLGRWSLSLSLTHLVSINIKTQLKQLNHCVKHETQLLYVKSQEKVSKTKKNQIKHTTAGRLECVLLWTFFISFSSWILFFSVPIYQPLSFWWTKKKWLNEMKWMKWKKSKKIKYNLLFSNLPRSFSRIKI